jgi:hypothetical protein
MENQDQNNLKEAILEKIQKGEVKMRPKAFFFVKVAFLVVVAFITFVVSVLLVSYTFFNLKAGGHLFLLSFGGRGFYEFFLLFPWFLLLVDVGLILFLDGLLKRFKFGYHNPVLYVFIGSILIVTVAGSFINMTSFHKNILQMAENKKLPIPGVGSFYSELHKSHKENGLFRGMIISVATSSFVLKGDEDTSFDVYTPSNFDALTFFHVGDTVFVAGDVDGNTVHAYGIHLISKDD